ncbi:MAG: aldo/keto reductase [Planctomycetaceae bacterium]|nr:aldo/keto reductase [Planctomycetaceae bacterium]
MEKKNINRREFFRVAAGSGLAAAITSSLSFGADSNAPANSNKPAKPKFPQVPTRTFGKANVSVPMLSLGAMFDTIENQIILYKSMQWGINYWDTAHGYAGGKSEEGIGMYFAKNPNKRKDVFLVTKASGASDSASRTDRLQTSFKRMNTNYIDLYFGVHGMNNPADLNDDLKNWAADAKAKAQIKYFGFTTHKNMTACLEAAAKTDWIDAIMTSYNFRLMQDPKFMAAVDTCKAKGIALIAMKTQAGRSDGSDEKPLDRYFLDKGFTEGQAKIKTVLQDDKICSACVGMKNIALLTSNVAAILDKTRLTQSDLDFMNSYAKETSGGYCNACGACSAAVPQIPYVSDVMRSLMYHNKYGDVKLAKGLFAEVQAKTNCRIGSADYSAAEKVCPNGNRISKLMLEAERLMA